MDNVKLVAISSASMIGFLLPFMTSAALFTMSPFASYMASSGMGIIPYDDPHNLYIVGGRPFPKELRPLINSDLVIAIGFDMVEYDPVIWNAVRNNY